LWARFIGRSHKKIPKDKFAKGRKTDTFALPKRYGAWRVGRTNRKTDVGSHDNVAKDLKRRRPFMDHE
jgi:hypothetical protein